MKTMKKYLSMAALALVGAMMTGCSNVDDVQQPVNDEKVLTLKTTISFDGDGSTNRALTVDFGEKKATKTFAVGDQIVVYYKDNGNNSRRVVSGALTDPDISADGKSANFTVSFTYTPGNNAQLRYVYPLNMAGASISTDTPISDINTFNYSNLTNQTGALADLGSTLDLATFDGYFSGTSLPASATLTNRLAILALTLKNSEGSSIITSGLKSVTISDGANSYNVAPTSGTFGEDVIYAAIRPVTTSTALDIEAGDGTYVKTLTSRTYAAGNFYNLALRMPLVYPITLSKVTSAYIGSVITSDGYVYATASDATAASKTAVAMICYVGAAGSADNSTGSEAYKGLALALENAGTNVKWCSQYGAICLTTQYDIGQQTNDMSGIANTDNLISGHAAPDVRTHPAASAARNYAVAHPTGTSAWFLLSAGQWDKMVNACKNVLGTNNNYRDLRDGFSARGGTNLLSAYYQTSTEKSTSHSFRFDFSSGSWNSDYKDVNGGGYVRPAFAF